MINFLEETLMNIVGSRHTPFDVIFIGTLNGDCCTFQEFVKIADFEYSNEYGCVKILYELIIVFSDGSTLKRREYDGYEGWKVFVPFKMPKKLKPIESLMGE